jgi:hypothetical protein
MDFSTPGISTLFQDYGLISFGSAEIFSTSSLSAGTYTYYFTVDINGQYYIDSVVVTVAESATESPPVTTITANDSEGPVNINTGDLLSITIGLDPGSYSGATADWYIIANTPSGWQSFDVSQMDFSTSGISASHQDYGLISLDSAEIFSTASLSAGTYTYYFAVDLSGQFYLDNITVTVTTGEVSAPTEFTASASGDTLTLSWSAVSGAEGYNLYYGLSSGNYLGPLDLGNTTVQSFSGLPDGTYYFAVTAYSGPDESGYSDEVSVTVNVQ